MYYELRRYNEPVLINGVLYKTEYDIICTGTIEQIALRLFENESEVCLNESNIQFFAISESEVNKSLLVVEVARIEKESN